MRAAGRSRALLAWYGANRRDLPWRATHDPWPILVSEIMLQQTQAKRVVPFYQRFMARYPAPVMVAQAPAAEVLALWSGLGYNRRAIRLQEAARRITRDGWPRDAAGLQALPGIGPYTAAAVACFAFGEQVPTPDTNHRRVLSRWFGRPLTGGDLIAAASRELPPGRAVEWNQAVMDLGAGLCSPCEPSCRACPVDDWCVGPNTYVAPTSQGPFRGSNREARGAVVRGLLERGPLTLVELSAAIDLDQQRAHQALTTLAKEGMVQESADHVFRLPGL